LGECGGEFILGTKGKFVIGVAAIWAMVVLVWYVVRSSMSGDLAEAAREVAMTSVQVQREFGDIQSVKGISHNAFFVGGRKSVNFGFRVTGPEKSEIVFVVFEFMDDKLVDTKVMIEGRRLGRQ